MSLFPAYSECVEKTCDENKKPQETLTKPWQENTSFDINIEKIKELQQQPVANEEAVQNISSDSQSSSSSNKSEEDEPTKLKKRKHKRKKHSTKRTCQPLPIFDGSEDYYVDKKSSKIYKTVDTLHKPACPRYRRRFHRCLGWNLWMQAQGRPKLKRYFLGISRNFAKEFSASLKLPLAEEDYNKCLSDCNRQVLTSPDNLSNWLQLIELQDQNPYKWSRLLLAEKKLDLIQRALSYHARNETLYRLYIEIVNSTYPAFEVSKMLDKLLHKDPYNYILWTAQIMTTQGTMARCVVPDVLQIYERSMQKMHHNAQKRTADAQQAAESDDVILKLFYNCALFLRQAGLMEMFFALIKLAVELNVSPVLFGDFAPASEEQQTLIEYEELVLQSGLPMNEIWLRIEKLRQSYNFLPCPAHAQISDPQRIVFNEDICHYIYPLKQRDSAFRMLLLILRLMKVPFLQTDSLAEIFNARVENIGESDAIEDALALCIRSNFSLCAVKHEDFVRSLHDLAKDMAVSPTFINNNIAHDIYVRCLSDFILNCAASYAGIDERRRLVFLLLWCRFERLQLILNRLSEKETPTNGARQRFKSLLKQQENRNLLPIYTEYAIYEYERAPQEQETWLNIFRNIIVAQATNSEGSALELRQADLCQMYLSLAEILVSRGEHEEALQLISSLILEEKLTQSKPINDSRILVAFQRLDTKLHGLIDVEKNVEIMILEQYLLPDYTVILLRMHCLMHYLMGHQMEVMQQLDRWLRIFTNKKAARQHYLREQIYEVYVTIAQLPLKNCQIPTALYSDRVFSAVSEFPRNLFLLQQCSMLVASMPWYKIRASLLRNTPTVTTVIILIATARQRYLHTIQYTYATDNQLLFGTSNDQVSANDRLHAESIIRNRILDIFNTLIDADSQQKYSVLHKNALFWRFYLRFVSDKSTAFETSKKCLLTALDDCPWNKSLYMDGSTYVPQELSHLQDLIIEKQLRIYALPEELQILRET